MEPRTVALGVSATTGLVPSGAVHAGVALHQAELHDQSDRRLATAVDAAATALEDRLARTAGVLELASATEAAAGDAPPTGRSTERRSRRSRSSAAGSAETACRTTTAPGTRAPGDRRRWVRGRRRRRPGAALPRAGPAGRRPRADQRRTRRRPRAVGGGLAGRTRRGTLSVRDREPRGPAVTATLPASEAPPSEGYSSTDGA